jgi:hypothetical protein
MLGRTLFATRGADDALSRVLITDDGRFSVSAQLRRTVDSDDLNYGYVHLRAWFASPDELDGLGAFHVVVDLDGALLQMAVAETGDLAADRVDERMRENDIDFVSSDDLTAHPTDQRKASALCASGVTLRARAYASTEPSGESLLCLRSLCEPLGAMQVVISDCGRLLAIATGRRDRDAYKRVRQDVARKGFALGSSDAAGGESGMVI